MVLTVQVPGANHGGPGEKGGRAGSSMAKTIGGDADTERGASGRQEGSRCAMTPTAPARSANADSLPRLFVSHVGSVSLASDNGHLDRLLLQSVAAAGAQPLLPPLGASIELYDVYNNVRFVVSKGTCSAVPVVCARNILCDVRKLLRP